MNNLKQILDILDKMGLRGYVTVDLSMVKKLGYYTGMIFNGNTYQMGFPVLAGGRYDNLAEKMGKKLEATGFSLSLEMAIKALERQGQTEELPVMPAIVSFSESMRDCVLSVTKDIEEDKNIQVLPDSDDLERYMKERNISRMARCIEPNHVIIRSNGKTEKTDFAKWRALWNI